MTVEVMPVIGRWVCGGVMIGGDGKEKSEVSVARSDSELNKEMCFVVWYEKSEEGEDEIVVWPMLVVEVRKKICFYSILWFI